MLKRGVLMKNILLEIQETLIKQEPHERIRFLRRQRNLTIKQAAEKFIITEKAWSDWESGKVIPRRKNRKRIAMILGVNERTIFGKLEIYIS